MKPGQLPRGFKSNKNYMWALSAPEMKTCWTPAPITSTPTESKVAISVATCLLTDAPRIISGGDIRIPTPQEDNWRAQECFLWLATKALPIWLDVWVSEHEPWTSDDVRECGRELTEPSDNKVLGEIVMRLNFLVGQPSQVHRRSMHKAQAMGVRAAYHGALLHPDDSIPMLAFAACSVLVRCVPDDNNPTPEFNLTMEATQSSMLCLVDKILEDKHA